MYGRLWPRNDDERQAALDAGYDLDKVLDRRHGPGDNVFFAATGVTDGELLREVRFRPNEVLTQSLSMRSVSGAVRLIEARHQLDRSANLVTRPVPRPVRLPPRFVYRSGAAGGFAPAPLAEHSLYEPPYHHPPTSRRDCPRPLFGQRRVTRRGCQVQLSTYNPANRCYTH